MVERSKSELNSVYKFNQTLNYDKYSTLFAFQVLRFKYCLNILIAINIKID